MYIHLILFIFTLLIPALTQADIYQASINPVPVAVQQQMKLYTWRPGCPVPLQDLVCVTVTYWGFDQKSHQGVLIVHKERAHDTVTIFRRLYAAKFPVYRMQPLYLYQGDDNKSMADNNTSAFNCRLITGNAAAFSQHSFGTAIDINPVLNPYVKGNTVLPVAGKTYLNRHKIAPGMITPASISYQLFMQAGWSWGGNWHSLQDYQHFEKPLNNS